MWYGSVHTVSPLHDDPGFMSDAHIIVLLCPWLKYNSTLYNDFLYSADQTCNLKYTDCAYNYTPNMGI